MQSVHAYENKQWIRSRKLLIHNSELWFLVGSWSLSVLPPLLVQIKVDFYEYNIKDNISNEIDRNK